MCDFEFLLCQTSKFIDALPVSALINLGNIGKKIFLFARYTNGMNLVYRLFLILFLIIPEMSQGESTIDFTTPVAAPPPPRVKYAAEIDAVQKVLGHLIGPLHPDPPKLKGLKLAPPCYITRKQFHSKIRFKRKIEHRFEFTRTCHIDGVVTIEPDLSVIELKLKNFGPLYRIVFTLEITSKYFRKLKVYEVKISFWDGKLFPKDDPYLPTFEFSGDYNILTKRRSYLVKNKGGTIFVEKYLGKKVGRLERMSIE